MDFVWDNVKNLYGMGEHIIEERGLTFKGPSIVA